MLIYLLPLNCLQNVKASLGDLMYRYINCDQFSPECLLDCLDLASERQALDVANRLEAAIYILHQRASKTLNTDSQSNSKSSWEMVKDLVIDAEKREELADRAESLLLCLKQRFPGLSQTTLDTSKIQCNTVLPGIRLFLNPSVDYILCPSSHFAAKLSSLCRTLANPFWRAIQEL